MGFGKKTDFETGRTLDLDKTYRNIIKPAVKAAGLECIRADEIVHSGLIDVPMYEQLLNADVVVADLSTSNKNAFYELGVRHALKPYTTIVICEDGIKSFPFDVNHVAVRQYHHMGEGIDFDEVERFRGVLSEAIREIFNRNPRPKDSPVYAFLNNLTPPALAEAMEGVAEEVAKAGPVLDAAAQAGGVVYSELMQQAEEAQKEDDFVTAKALLTRLRRKTREAARQAAEEAAAKRKESADGVEGAAERPEDPYLIQRLALVTYKSKHPTPQAALEEARDLLATLDPETSNDTETLGLWGVSGEMAHLDEAVRGYERGFHLRNDYYNGINLAFLHNVYAAAYCRRALAAATPEQRRADRAESVSCFVLAARVRREVLKICEKVLETERLADDDKYWVLATVAEARLGMGDEAGAESALQEAFAVASAEWMKASTREQMGKLRALLAESPLEYVTADAP
jgi:hypothetical protein